MQDAKFLGVLGLLITQLTFVAVPARADLIQVPIDGATNADIRTYTDGFDYPVAPTTLTVGGVPFDLVPLDSVPNSLGVIQTPPGASIFTIPTNVLGPTTVYTLMNSAFGSLGADIATLEFTGAGGAFASFDLIEGFNVRDHFNGVFVNVVTDPTIVTADFGRVRLDRQTFDLPASFASDTLTQIRLIGHGGFPEGEAFLAAVEVGTVPEPATLLLLGAGITGLAGASRRKISKAVTN